VVYRLKSVCDEAKVPHPTIVERIGPAMVAYSSVLVFDVLGKSCFESRPDLEKIKADIAAETEKPQPVQDLLDAFEAETDRNMLEVYHDAIRPGTRP